MVSFSFQPEFVPMIESGRKIQTIRRTRRCDVGDRMHLYTGLRTKRCKLIAVKKAVQVENISIAPSGITIGVHPVMVTLDTAYSDLFAFADGFLNYRAMYEWFLDNYKQEVFHGFLHRWSAL